MNLFDTVSNDIKEAMKARDKVALDTLRNIKKAFLEAKTAPGAADELPDEAALKILQKLAKQGREAAETFSAQGRQDLAGAELEQVEVIGRYLPKPLTPEELEKAVAETIAQTGAAGPGDMGKVMAAATKALAGKADGKAISAVVRRLLV